jgi:glutamine kinase
VNKARIPLGTKAETLARLAPVLTTARVLPMTRISLRDWRAHRERLLDRVLAEPWAGDELIVRSSAQIEDSPARSHAGRFRTMAGVRGWAQLAAGVDAVFASYDAERDGDQVLIQPQLRECPMSGVACVPEPSSGAPYVVVNWVADGSTDAVTAGRVGGLHTWYGADYRDHGPLPPPLPAVRSLLAELREVTGEACLEVEFAVAADDSLVLLQARPLVVRTSRVPAATHRQALARVVTSIDAARRPRPPALGRPAVFGVMPDWNPAEIVGLRPRPLSLSLYRYLITDEVWARARYRCGYRDLRGVPLLVDFCGLPYVDVRASMSSLLPADLPERLAGRLVDHWLATLVAQPHLHDKIESRIVVSCLGLGSRGRVDALAAAGFSAEDRHVFGRSLRRLTNRLVAGPLWEQDLGQVGLLGSVGYADAGASPHAGSALRAQLDACVEHGTLPFARLARAAFVATELLDDLVAEEVFTVEDKAAFVGGLNTVARELKRDFETLDKATFLKRYGHLRPGTYDILSPRYDEDPERYFDWSAQTRSAPARPAVFVPRARQLRMIDRLVARAGFTFDAHRLLAFVAATIRGRERAKFEFTSVLSDALSGIRRLGERLGYSADDLSYVPVATILRLAGDSRRDARRLRSAVALGREAYATTGTVALPPLITEPGDAWEFHLPATRPNFVTQGRVLARVADVDAGDPPDGAIALVASADPGYDWLFSRGIAGLVTAFGGVNSHMAIRALELGIPAVIGVGEAVFRRWLAAAALDIDAAGGLVEVLS